MSTKEIVELIKGVGKAAIERDTLYNEIRDFTDVTFEEEKGFIPLTVLN